MNNLNQTIQQMMVQAMKDRDRLKLDVLRFVRSQIKNQEIDKQKPLDNKEIVKIIRNLVKKQKEEVVFLRQAGRTDQADQESQKTKILKSLLPPEMKPEEITAEIRRVVSKEQLTNQNFGRLMARLITHFNGRVAGDALASALKQLIK